MPLPGSRRSTVRFRITAVAALAVAGVLLATAVALVALQRRQLLAAVDTALAQQADQLVPMLEDDDDGTTMANSNSQDRAVQLVSIDGTVLAWTPNLRDRPAIADPPEGRQTFRTIRGLPIEDDSYRVLSRRITLPQGEAVLHVADNTDDLQDTVRGLALALAVAIPAVVALMTALTWWLIGRTLQPVEAIRRQVTAMTGLDTSGRVTVPEQDDEIARLATTMNQMLDRISVATERQRRFVADASHELRTPLTRIRTDLEVDLGQPDRADLEATHQRVLADTLALQRMIDDLLYLAEADAEAVPLRAAPLDLDDVVLHEVRRVRSRSNVEVDIGAVSAAHLEGDRDQLIRVIRNLLDNAIRHAEKKVVLSLSETAAGVRFVISDDGAGIEAEAADRIFERFGRGEDARARESGGAGLGLAISREIVENHGGTLVLEDRRQARFVLTIPHRPRPSDS